MWPVRIGRVRIATVDLINHIGVRLTTYKIKANPQPLVAVQRPHPRFIGIFNIRLARRIGICKEEFCDLELWNYVVPSG